MIEFLKNLFKKKEEYQYPPSGQEVEHFIEENGVEVFVDRDRGIIRIEAPASIELSQEEIVEICRRHYESM